MRVANLDFLCISTDEYEYYAEYRIETMNTVQYVESMCSERRAECETTWIARAPTVMRSFRYGKKRMACRTWNKSHSHIA